MMENQNKLKEIGYHDGKKEEAKERIKIWKEYLERFINNFPIDWYYDYIKNYLREGSSVLDLGCGVGYFSFLLEKKINANFFGIDISRTEIKAGKRYAKKNKLKSKIFVGDAEKLNFKDNSFDFVFCLDVLHHFTNTFYKQKIVLGEVYRVLKKKGIFIIFEPNSLSPLQIIRKIFRKEWGSINENPLSLFGLIKQMDPNNFLLLKKKTIKFVPTKWRLWKFEKFLSHIPFINLFGNKIYIVLRKK